MTCAKHNSMIAKDLVFSDVDHVEKDCTDKIPKCMYKRLPNILNLGTDAESKTVVQDAEGVWKTYGARKLSKKGIFASSTSGTRGMRAYKN